MISAISQINFYNQRNSISFQGKSWKKAADLCFDCFQPSEEVKFFRKNYNFAPKVSEAVNVYKGPKDVQAGLSTENLEDVGGGYLVGNCLTPLSTTGVRSCAVLNLIDLVKGKSVLYHVFHKTTASKIEEFIKKFLPSYDRVNIVGGDQYKTAATMKRIIQAVDNTNPNAEKVFYHTLSENPEVIAYCGDMYYMRGSKGSVSFVQKDNYWY